MTINEFINDVHSNAVDHGWWDGERDIGEIIALIHSELSEALEEYRFGHDMVWYTDNGKPEGVAIELCDAVIRIFDLLGENGYFERFAKTEEALNELHCLYDVKTGHQTEKLPVFVCSMHELLSYAYRVGNNRPFYQYEALMCTVRSICTWIHDNGLDPEVLLLEKHNFNKTRPYRHGGKKC